MKKKRSNSSTKISHPSRRPPVFCDPAGVANASLGGIALRVLMSDIRKNKLGDENASEKDKAPEND
jgi:hypothetical protein